MSNQTLCGLNLDKRFEDNSIEEIYARHTLEHFSFSDFNKALKIINRILKPSGRFNIIVPDLKYHFQQLCDDENLFKPSMLQGDSIVSNYQHAISGIYGWQRSNENNKSLK